MSEPPRVDTARTQLSRRQILSILVAAGASSFVLESYGALPATAAVPWCFPLGSRRGYSQRWGTGTPYSHFYVGGVHRGVDFDPGAGAPVYAAASGRAVGYDDGTGWQGTYVSIGHPSGWRTLYAHLREALVRPGDDVTIGQMIGRVGNTGKPSTGAHLHFEIWAGPSRAHHIDPWPHIRDAPVPSELPAIPPQEEDDMFNDEDRNLLRAAATARQPFIRIQATGRGIALIGANYFKGLAPSELEASSALMSHHLTVSDATFDQYKALAIGGETSERSTIKTEARPLRLYRYKGALIAVGPGGKHWSVPSDAYRILLQAVGLVGEIMRDLGTEDNELNFIKQVLSNVAPDPVAQQTADSVLSLPSSEAEALAKKVLDGSLV